MAAGLRKMQENRGFSENRIDKLRFSVFFDMFFRKPVNRMEADRVYTDRTPEFPTARSARREVREIGIEKRMRKARGILN